MLVGDTEDVVALVRLHSLYKDPLRVLEMHLDSARRGKSRECSVRKYDLPCAGFGACKVPMPHDWQASVRDRVTGSVWTLTCTRMQSLSPALKPAAER